MNGKKLKVIKRFDLPAEPAFRVTEPEILLFAVKCNRFEIQKPRFPEVFKNFWFEGNLVFWIGLLDSFVAVFLGLLSLIFYWDIGFLFDNVKVQCCRLLKNQKLSNGKFLPLNRHNEYLNRKIN